MKRIWVYQGEFGWGKDFKWMSIAQFSRSFSVDQAVGFLGQIKHTLEKEAKVAPGEGRLYTGLRHVFAEIDGLGKLYCGEHGKHNSAPNTIEFGVEYLGQVDARYRDLFGLIVDMYRHGLAHTHLSKSIKFRGARSRWVTVGWGIADSESEKRLHLRLVRGGAQSFGLWVHVTQLVKDALSAIELYCADLKKQGKASALFRRFKRGYIGTASVFREPPPPPATKAGKKNPPRAALVLNRYSASGIAWLRKEIASGNALSRRQLKNLVATAGS